MSKHAFLSPSSSHRWLNCTPSACLESEFENKTSQAAEEGTAAHAWCEHKLKKALVNVNIKFTNSTNIKVTSLTNVYTPSSDESLSSLVRSFVR